MSCYNKTIGNYGENLSLKHLIKNNYKILDTNFRTSYGEIDIVATINNIIVFLEIKSRYTDSFGKAIESITYYKQKQIIKLSKYYIHKYNLYNYNVRYDIIEVYFNNRNNLYKLNHIIDAFRTY